MFSIIPKNQIIKNFTKPICNECIFFKSSNNNCMKYGEKNIITGEITYDTANSCRTGEYKCGTIGRYFEKINAL